MQSGREEGRTAESNGKNSSSGCENDILYFISHNLLKLAFSYFISINNKKK